MPILEINQFHDADDSSQLFNDQLKFVARGDGGSSYGITPIQEFISGDEEGFSSNYDLINYEQLGEAETIAFLQEYLELEAGDEWDMEVGEYVHGDYEPDLELYHDMVCNIMDEDTIEGIMESSVFRRHYPANLWKFEFIVSRGYCQSDFGKTTVHKSLIHTLYMDDKKQEEGESERVHLAKKYDRALSAIEKELSNLYFDQPIVLDLIVDVDGTSENDCLIPRWEIEGCYKAYSFDKAEYIQDALKYLHKRFFEDSPATVMKYVETWLRSNVEAETPYS